MPQTTLYYNLEVSATRYPDKTAIFDAHRGETVKAVVVLKAASEGRVAAEDIVGWCKTRMAAYKYPRMIEFVDGLPKSATGKVMWRQLQEREAGKART